MDNFLSEDGGIDEIIEAVSDEVEREYISFMTDLFAICDKLEADSKKNDMLKTVGRGEKILVSDKLFEDISHLLPRVDICQNLVKPFDTSMFIRRD